MHKSENEKIDFILDEHEQIFRKQGSLCMALGKGFLVIAILCGVATFCVSGLYLKPCACPLPAVVGYSVVFLIITAYRRNHAWYSVVRNYSGLCV